MHVRHVDARLSHKPAQLRGCRVSGVWIAQGVPEQVALECGPCLDGAGPADGAAA